MSIRNKVPSSVILTAAVVLFGAVGFGQEAQKQGQEQDRQRTAPSTMTGCLTKGDTAGQYAFTDTKSGNKTTVVPSSGVDLDKHAANHTVKLTGTLSEDGKTLTATNVEHVSATCEATK
jgi:hypothetical protein